VQELAGEAGMDIDEALVTLWDAGLEYLDGSKSTVSTRHVRTARTALGLDDKREQMNVEYWTQLSGLTREELATRLDGVGVKLPAGTRRIPRNSLRRVRQLFADASSNVESTPETAAAAAPTPVQPSLPALQWEAVGGTQTSCQLTEADVMAIHVALENDFADSGDPIQPPGVKNPGLLASALHRPFAAFGQFVKYPTAEMSGAALFHSLVLNHPFHNGNKRTALVSLLAFLDANGLVLTCSQDNLFRFTLRVAQHALIPVYADQLSDRETLEIARWIRSNTRAIDRREQPMKWARLRQKLREFGCHCEPAPRVGNRLNIVRDVPRRTRFGRTGKPRTLRTQVAWSGDGTDADRNTVHKIRADLHLDDAHDVDSSTFYRGAEIDDFIVEYRRILRRLSRL
jgi:death-on-curing family protein